MLLHENYHKGVKDFFKDLIFHFNGEDEILEYITEMSRELFNFKVKTQSVNLSELNHISQRLGVSIETIFAGKVDWSAVKKQFFTKCWSLPEEYTKAAGTHISVIHSWLTYIRNKYNYETAQTILDHLQTTKACLHNDNLMVNVVLVNKFLRYCTKFLNFNKEHIREMSLLSYQQTQRKFIFDLAQSSRSDREVLSLMVERSAQYEKNFDYKLIEGEDYLCIRSVSKQEIHDELKLKQLTTPEILLFKQYTVENTTLLMGRNPMKLLKTESKIVNGLQQVNFFVRENNLSSPLDVVLSH